MAYTSLAARRGEAATVGERWREPPGEGYVHGEVTVAEVVHLVDVGHDARAPLGDSAEEVERGTAAATSAAAAAVGDSEGRGEWR